jgi:hypothetical protein
VLFADHGRLARWSSRPAATSSASICDHDSERLTQHVIGSLPKGLIIRLLPWHRIRVLLLSALLVLPVLSSFARVITYSSFQGSGGTYTFWEAVHRYFNKIN